MPIWQQAFLHAYALLFAWNAVAWLLHKAAQPRERAPAVTWLGITAACYLVLQYWLLEQWAFSVVAGGVAAAIAVLGGRVPRAASGALRESAFVIAALYAASAVLGADVGLAFKGLVLFAQGVLMLLATRHEASRVRIWVARAVTAAGALGVLPLAGYADASVWALGLVTLGALAGSLALSQASRHHDSMCLVGVAGLGVLGAASVLSTRLLPGTTASFDAMLCLLLLALTSVLAGYLAPLPPAPLEAASPEAAAAADES